MKFMYACNVYVCTGLQLIQYAIRFTALTVQIYSSYVQVYSSDSTQQTTCIVLLTSLSQILQTNFYLFQNLPEINWFALNNFFLLKLICDVIYTSIQPGLVVIEALENFAKKISGMGIKVGVQYAVINFFFF